MILNPSQATKSSAEKPYGGDGYMDVLSYITDKTRPAGSKFSLGAEISLPPGAGVGYHTHPSDEEIYFIVKGTGCYVENDKSEHPVSPGFFTLCPRGEGHAIKNNSNDTLTFLAFIAE
ncbi:MAG: cupin domain-containing protein [Deltaproteobacteria bacterium]|jgi:quercetin dioxygenase-like cupin family protein|nr:cupin domain-containing protein [Deltaproteobacteria bacterium]